VRPRSAALDGRRRDLQNAAGPSRHRASGAGAGRGGPHDPHPGQLPRRERFTMKHLLPLCVVIAAASFTAAGAPAENEAAPPADAQAANKKLGRGINLGNALEAPKEGDWGVTLKAEYFRAIKAAGFDTVRLPVNWAAHAGAEAPYTIDPAFAARVDWAV